MNKALITRAMAISVAGIIALSAWAVVDDITLKRRPKVGDVAEYKVSANFDTDQGAVLFAQKRVEKITDVKADGGYVTELTTSETKISFGGQDLPEQPETKGSEEVGPDGLVRSITSETPADANTFRIANLHSFKAPDGTVKVGDSINFEIPADAKKGTPAVKAAYTVVGPEKVKDWDAIKLTFSTGETAADTKASVKGTVWLSAADGSVVRVEETWKDVQPTGAPFPVSGKYNVERVK